ncbi:hypothetical protein [Nonomuraea longicatena]|uniref:Uncharacterized protein n=1 Tax=Nonomuraea longicatena TaxID=83682 RepID=A0ABP4BLC0_9ACTN
MDLSAHWDAHPGRLDTAGHGPPPARFTHDAAGRAGRTRLSFHARAARADADRTLEALT